MLDDFWSYLCPKNVKSGFGSGFLVIPISKEERVVTGLVLLLVLPVSKRSPGHVQTVLSDFHVTSFPWFGPSYLQKLDQAKGRMTRGMYMQSRLGIRMVTIVSFDIPQEDMARRRLVHRFIHGRSENRISNGKEVTYTYPGLLDEGGFRLGQSVYLFPPDLAIRFILRLRELKVFHRHWDVFGLTNQRIMEAFKSPRPL